MADDGVVCVSVDETLRGGYAAVHADGAAKERARIVAELRAVKTAVLVEVCADNGIGGVRTYLAALIESGGASGAEEG